jgi:hypothetical protein
VYLFFGVIESTQVPRVTQTESRASITVVELATAIDMKRNTNAFVAGDEGKVGLHGAPAIHGMRVGAAYSKRAYFRQRFAWTWVGESYLVVFQGLLEIADERTSTFCRHSVSSPTGAMHP